MAYSLQGTVWIPLYEFWRFVHEQCADTVSVADPLFHHPRLMRSQGTLRLSVSEQGSDSIAEEADIELTAFWRFALDFLPPTDGALYQFGVPRGRSGDLVIDYAINSECEPRHMAEKPPACTQWDGAADVIELVATPGPHETLDEARERIADERFAFAPIPGEVKDSDHGWEPRGPNAIAKKFFWDNGDAPSRKCWYIVGFAPGSTQVADVAITGLAGS